jgi:uncharacterized protein (DUF885 family)
MNIDALLTSKDPDELRTLALKLLADLEQQTQRNQTQAGYIQQLEEALKNARQWRFGRKSEAFQGNNADCSTKISRPMPPISSGNWLPCYPGQKHPDRK